MTGTFVRLLAALSAGLGAWCSLGVLAVAPSGGRFGLLPPVAILLVALLVATVIVLGFRWSVSRSLPLFAALVFAAPWLPGTTVSPFLIFTGPIAGLWWTIIAVACLVAGPLHTPPFVTALVRDPRRAPWVAGAIVALVSSGAALNFQERIPAGDEPHYLVITQSLLYDGDLQIENNHKRGDYVSYYPGELPPDYLRRGVNRQIYSIHAPGLSLVILPAFAVGGYPVVVAFLIVCGALGSALAWWLGYRATRDATAAWAGWAAVATSITFVAHTFTVYPDGLSGACVVLGLWALFVRADLPAWRFTALGAATALLPWLHTRNAPVALVIGLAVAWPLLRQRAWRQLAAWMAPLSVSALAWLAFFRIIYGVFDPAAPYGGYTQSGFAHVPRGIVGLLFDQQFGLLAYAPAVAIGLVGLAIMALPRRTPGMPAGADDLPVSLPALALVLLAIVVPYAMLSASYAMWWGGASAPARFLTPVVLPLAIPAAVVWHRWRSRAARAVMFGLIVSSGVVLLALLTHEGGRLALNARDGFSLLADWASPAGDLSQALPALHRDAIEVAVWRAAIWMCVPLVCLAVGWAMTRRAGRSRGAVALGMIVAAVTGAGLAADVGWRLRGVNGRRPDASQVRLLEALSRAPAGALAIVFRDAPRNDGFGRAERTTKQVTHDDLSARLSFSTTFRHLPRDTAFGAGLLPAGRYQIRATTRDAATGPVDVSIGRDGATLRRLPWDRPEGAATATAEFDLVAPVRLVTVGGEPAATATVSSVVIQPVQVWRRDDRLGDESVERLAVYGPYFVYLLSDAQYVEPDGMWIRPSVAVPMIVARDGEPSTGPLRVFLRNGPFENDIVLSGTASQSTTLAPNEERIVTLDVTWVAGAARISVRASRGFRPFQVDPAATDRRLLGVWVAFP